MCDCRAEAGRPEATQRELELEYKQRQAADESVRLAGQELARARLERDSAKAQFDQHVEWASAEIARVEAARDDAEAKYLACYEELTRVEAARAALEAKNRALLDRYHHAANHLSEER